MCDVDCTVCCDPAIYTEQSFSGLCVCVRVCCVCVCVCVCTGTVVVSAGERRWLGLCSRLDGCVEWRREAEDGSKHLPPSLSSF